MIEPSATNEQTPVEVPQDGTAAAGPPPPSGKARRIIRVLSSGGLICLLALLTTELLMRLFGIQPERYPYPYCLTWCEGEYRNLGMVGQEPYNNKYYGRRQSQYPVQWGEWVPGARLKMVYASNPRGYFDADNTVLHEINNLGFRGPDTTVNKPAGVYRILGMGDSFAFGLGVREEDTFLRRLETSLNRDAPSGRRFEVLNAGVGGYNTLDEVVYLENLWHQSEPDLVLVIFYINDAYAYAMINSAEQWTVHIEKFPGLAQYSYLWDYIRHTWEIRTSNRAWSSIQSDWYFQDPQRYLEKTDSGPIKIFWPDSKKGLMRLPELARKHNFQVAVVIFPEMISLDDRHPYDRFYQFVIKTCSELGLPTLNLIDAFRGQDGRSLWVHPSDSHPNEIAHGIAAEAIERFVRETFIENARKSEVEIQNGPP